MNRFRVVRDDEPDVKELARRVKAQEAGTRPGDDGEDTTPTFRRRRATAEQHRKTQRRRVILAALVILPLVAAALVLSHRRTPAARPVPVPPRSVTFGDFLRQEEAAEEEAYRRWQEPAEKRGNARTLIDSIGQAIGDFFTR